MDPKTQGPDLISAPGPANQSHELQTTKPDPIFRYLTLFFAIFRLMNRSWPLFLLCLMFVCSGLEIISLLRAQYHLTELEIAQDKFVPVIAELLTIERVAKKGSLYYLPVFRYRFAGQVYDIKLDKVPDYIWRDNYGESKAVPILVNPDAPASVMFESKVVQAIWLPRYESSKKWLLGLMMLSGVMFLWVVWTRRSRRAKMGQPADVDL